ncbi:hypothetical protein HCG51_18185 [Tolypothrix sp. PCC 7910]|uniref:hypothetical protein n=1 Tax=Tolypothrix sp. PCC 7910 TaxID=2099387 RepID=UPI0014279EE0|nr:hypothetical protein [Tolypothrix sp. PCC 7910]QIR38442.1 hypothetical protein HCG51_18185 [Tolypothrix sp. PCC 7910]
MVTVVVVLNTLISLILLYVAWRVWQLKREISILADRFTHYERCCHAVLYTAPEKISTAQQNIYNLRQGNQRLEEQIQQVRQIVSLLFLGRQVWRRSFPRIVSTNGKKTITK